MKESRDQIYLERIIESIDWVDHFIATLNQEAFLKDKKTVDACLMQLINIGEMANHVTVAFREQHADLPWHKAIGMRNEIAHGYFEIEAAEVWGTCQKDLPELKARLVELLQ